MKTQIAAYVGVALVLVGLWFFGLYVPLHREHVNLAAQTIETQQQLDDFKRIMNELPGFIEAHESLRSRKAALSSKLYTKDDILKLFDQLKRQAQKQNMLIMEISPSVEELLYLNSIVPDSSQPQFLNISLDLKGGYISFGRFVGQVEQSGYFRGINYCKVIGSKDTRDDIRLQLGFKALLGGIEGKV